MSADHQRPMLFVQAVPLALSAIDLFSALEV